MDATTPTLISRGTEYVSAGLYPAIPRHLTHSHQDAGREGFQRNALCCPVLQEFALSYAATCLCAVMVICCEKCPMAVGHYPE